MGNNETFRTTVGGMVDKLEGLTNKDEIVRLLQDINEEILKYEIKADQYTIYPIWVEAYYYNDEVFKDKSCHRGSNRPGQFKFRKHTRGSGGVDLYLGKPNGDYLSFLIKLALIKEEGKDAKLCSQVQIKDELIDYLDKEILVEKLGTYLKWLEKNNKLVECASDNELKEKLNNYLSNQETKESLKKYLLDTVGQKTELVFSDTSLDKTYLKMSSPLKRVNVNTKGNKNYNDLELASFYWKNEKIAKDKSSKDVYDELKKANGNEGNELYKLK